jgi:hypothetical protein
VVPDPVVIGDALEIEELDGLMMTMTVVTPEVTVEGSGSALVEVVTAVVMDVVPAAQYDLYQLCSNCRSLSAGQNASQVPSGEMRSCARRPDWQKQLL